MLLCRFVGGELNTCYNALDLHVEEGRGDKTALIWDSPVSGNVAKFSYKELTDQVIHQIGKFAECAEDLSYVQIACAAVFVSLNNSSRYCFLLLFYENFAAGTAAEI